MFAFGRLMVDLNKAEVNYWVAALPGRNDMPSNEAMVKSIAFVRTLGIVAKSQTKYLYI